MTKAMMVGWVLLAVSTAYAGTGADWTYSGETGPDHWVELGPEYAPCDGRNQSPINLTGFIEADLEPISFIYHSKGGQILNNGHTVQVNFPEGSHIVVDGVRFDLKQCHFHVPSENQIDGKSFPMEAHLVHADKDGNLAVVGVMLVEGEENTTLASAWSQMPENPSDQSALPSTFTIEEFLPANRDYYRYNGSLTTPPCSEGVRWLVMKEPISASGEQIRAFAEVMGHPNNRPIQPVYARPVLK